ncbi:MAG: hypothetical protein H7Z41_04340 [Cytophagales bacterium]|nr:hypothetical protein [Armatimonadota bacterium]
MSALCIAVVAALAARFRARTWALVFHCVVLTFLAPRTAWSGEGPVVQLAVDSAILGRGREGIYPLTAEIRCESAGPVAAEIVVRVPNDLHQERVYRQKLILSGGNVTDRIFLYPQTDGGTETLLVSLYGPFRTRETVLRTGPLRGGPEICLIGDHVGSLRHEGTDADLGQAQWNFQDHYLVPENAPDRAVGYSRIKFLVLGDGAERLNPAQWRAIRRWVTGGGSLIVLGTPSVARFGSNPDAADLLPVRLDVPALNTAHPADCPALPLPGPIDSLSFRPACLAPGAEVLDGHRDGTVLARRSLGAGVVLYAGFDPTSAEFRQWEGLPKLWQGLTKRAEPFLRAQECYVWDWDWEEREARSAHSDAVARDPFQIQFPSARMVLNLFLAYFVLAIPVTFIVLKRLRRMNAAWFTGPLLAVAFAGGLYLLTTRIYEADQSWRTGGMLLASAGSPEARFVGSTELFFPRAGIYSMTLPGAERLEQGYSASSSGLETVHAAGGDGVTVPGYPAGNLAFRRLFHTQTVSLGRGITADLRITKSTKGASVSGVIHNVSGRTLRRAVLLIPPKAVGRDPEAFSVLFAAVGDIAPGDHRITRTPIRSARANGDSSVVLGRHFQSLSLDRFVRTVYSSAENNTAPIHVPLLLAETSGESLGLVAGKWAGGDRSVAMLVSLPPLSNEKGGRR